MAVLKYWWSFPYVLVLIGNRWSTQLTELAEINKGMIYKYVTRSETLIGW